MPELDSENKIPDISVRLHRAALSDPDRIAVKITSNELTWGAFDQQVTQTANALIAAGLHSGDRVAALGRNSLSYIVLVFATLRAQGCITPLQTLASTEDLIGIINDSGAKFVFVATEYASDMLSRKKDLTTVAGHGIVSLDDDYQDLPSFSSFLASGSALLPEIQYAPNSPACLVYSSGTTGQPKGILQSREHKARECAEMGGIGLSPASRTLISTPVCSSTTLFILIAALGHGGTAIVMEKFDAVQFLALAERERVTHAILVPVQYQRILASPVFDRHNLSSFERKISIGAPLSIPTKQAILERWPAGGLLEFYGMTEGGPGCCLVADERPDKLDTVGQPGEGCDLKIINDEGDVLPQGQIGEVVGWSPKMMLGYWGREEDTQKASWYDEIGRRYHRSGDMGWLDDEGFLHLVDRKKDMIISGGFNVYAADIERVLKGHPDVEDAAVVGAPSQQWGESPVGFIVTAPAAAVSADALKDWANQRLGKLQRLAAVYPIDDLPRNPIGKILKRDLRAQAPEQP